MERLHPYKEGVHDYNHGRNHYNSYDISEKEGAFTYLSCSHSGNLQEILYYYRGRKFFNGLFIVLL
jgi:hypothetical protein